jgi:hypothetical protein
MRLTRSVRAIVVGGFLVGSGVLGNAESAAITPASLPIPAAFVSLPDSSALNTATLIKGNVVKSSGRRATTGFVLVYAHPRQIPRAGGSFRLEPVARARIGADGTFTARVPPSVDLRPNALRGVVDFQVRAFSGDQTATWLFSRSLTANGGLRPESPPGPSATAPPSTTGALSAATVAPQAAGSATVARGVPVVSMYTRTAPGIAKALETGALVGTGATFGDDPCRTLAVYTFRPVVLGQVYHYRRGVNSTFSYLVSSKSSLGGAIKLVGDSVGWQVGGSTTKTATSGVTWRARSKLSKTYYQVKYDYKKLACEQYYQTYHYLVPSTYREGASTYTTSHQPRAPHCTDYYERGATKWLVREKNLTWTNGVDVSTLIGFDLKSQSGWTEQVKVEFLFKQGGRRICGTLQVPVSGDGAPGFIVIRG